MDTESSYPKSENANGKDAWTLLFGPSDPLEGTTSSSPTSSPEAPGSDSQTEQEGPSWKRPCTLSDAFENREPLEYVIEGLFPIPSLSLIYGVPGDFKSMLLMDAAICVASGTPWLPPLKNGVSEPRTTHQVPVFWYDFDNGKRSCDERFQALAKSRNLTQASDLPFHYLSVPSPALDFNNADNVSYYLEPIIKEHGIKFLCIDNLTTVSGNVEENSVEMAFIMGNLRTLVERFHIACVVIHHQRKGNEKESHPGESLRGHSSINAAIDLALQVIRKRGANSVSVQSTKTRGREVNTFGAEFRYTSRPDDELETGQFFGIPATIADKNKAVEAAIIDLLLEQGTLNQSKIVEALKNQGSKTIVHNALANMVSAGQLTTEKREHNATFYRIN